MPDLFHMRARGTTAATELRGALATFLTMAYILVANPPILAAAGVPLVAFTVVPAAGSWQAAMGLVVLDGLLVLLLVVVGLREAVMNAIPLDMRRAIGVGIGLFIAFPSRTASATASSPTS